MIDKLDDRLDNELFFALNNGCDVASMRKILVKYQENGFSAASLHEFLSSMRFGADDELEDRILELMDIVSGFCSPFLKVW